jgi:hypothetical protein
MKIFQVRAEAETPGEPAAFAVVVAKDVDEAVLLLRKDINFSGFRLPPAHLIPELVDEDEVRRLLGEAAAHEKGVYAFALIEPATLP